MDILLNFEESKKLKWWLNKHVSTCPDTITIIRKTGVKIEVKCSLCRKSRDITYDRFAGEL